MRDEGTDISNIEQLSFCVRTIDNNFIDFIGFYEIVNLKNETVVTDNVKQLTSSIMGKHSETSTQISAEQLKDIATHIF